MRTISNEELKVILEKHQLWLDDNKTGEKADLSYVDLNYAELNGANLNYANLNDSNLNHAQLNNAELNNAQLNNANLNHAQLNNAELNYAELNSAQLNNAELNYAELIYAQLNDANLNYANLSNIKGMLILSFIQSRHTALFIHNNKTTNFQIGCRSHDIDYWKNNYGALATANYYALEEITKYKRFFDYCLTEIKL